jgi:hypothetical protein
MLQSQSEELCGLRQTAVSWALRFLRSSEQRVIISLYSIKWTVFIMEMGSAYCTVQDESVNTYDWHYFHWKLTEDAPVWHQASSCEIRGGQRELGQGFVWVLRFSLSITFHQCSILIIYTLLLPEGQMAEAWEPAIRQYSFRNRGALDTKALSTFFLFWMLVALRWHTALVRLGKTYGLWNDSWR